MQLNRSSKPWLSMSRRVSSRCASGQVMTTRSMAGMTRAFSSTWTMSGLPPSSRNCLGNGRPMRLPMPPASTTIPIFMRSSLCRRE